MKKKISKNGFHTLVDLLEMILAKSDKRIAKNYDVQLLTDANDKELGNELRLKLQEATDAVLSVSGNKQLQQHNPVLLRSLYVRNPYVDVLNIIQAELLKRIRSVEDNEINQTEIDELSDALLITINGVSAGMRNSG